MCLSSCPLVLTCTDSILIAAKPLGSAFGTSHGLDQLGYFRFQNKDPEIRYVVSRFTLLFADIRSSSSLKRRLLRGRLGPPRQWCPLGAERIQAGVRQNTLLLNTLVTLVTLVIHLLQN